MQVQQQQRQGVTSKSRASPKMKGEMKTIVPVPLICISCIRSLKLVFARSTTKRVAFAFIYEDRADLYPEFVLRSESEILVLLLAQ